MTSIIGLVKDDGAVMYSDGAAYDPKGIFGYAHQKTKIMLHLPCLLATRGVAKAGMLLENYGGLARSFDELVALLVELTRDASMEAFDLGEKINLRAVCCGWSESAQKFQGYQTALRGDHPESLIEGSLELKEFRHHFEPWPKQELLEERGLVTDGKLNLSGDDASVIAFMECQRQTAYRMGPESGDLEGCIVGAFIQKTTLVRDRAWTEIIHRWPDKIGEPLNSYT